jgi:hypothetical protein
MASITSIFILLFITYSYSVPIGPEYGSSTTPYQFTTGQTTVEHVNSVNMHLLSDDESTAVPTILKQRLSEESNSNEVTTDYVTPLYSSSTITYKKRDDEKDSKSAESESQEKRGFSTISTSTVTHKKRADDKDYKSEESESQEKRGFVAFPTSTVTYKKRDDDKDSKSEESENQEKRGLFTFSTSTVTYKKRDDDKDSKSAEKESQEKRGLFTFSTSTIPYKKRSDDKDSESAETESEEKRGLVTFPTSTKLYKKRDDDKDSKSEEHESQEKRDFEESSFPSSTVENFLFTTLETSNEFNRRAIQPIHFQDVPESSTFSLGNQVEVTTDIKPSSSFDSFVKYTGLLKDNQSSEELTTSLPIKTQPLIKTSSIIPGKIIQTKVFPNVPS